MRVTIQPGSLRGTVAAPPSKSMAHRMLICAALAAGESTVRPIELSEDVLATSDGLRALGAEIRQEEDALHVTGCDPAEAGSTVIPCRESGSTLRFLLPLCLLNGKEMTLTGSGRLPDRPLDVYETLCAERGFRLERTAEGIKVQGKLAPGEYTVRGDLSSQFLTGLLYALSLLNGRSGIRILPPVERPTSGASLVPPGNDALRGLGEVRPAAGDGWTVTSVADGITYYRFAGNWTPNSSTTARYQDVYVVDLDLSNPNYQVKVVYSNPSVECSSVFQATNARAAINGAYEKSSIALKVNTVWNGTSLTDYPQGIVESLMPNDYIAGTSVLNWKNEGTFYCDGARNLKIAFDGYDPDTQTKTKSVQEERLFYQYLFSTREWPALMSSAPMLIQDFNPVGKQFKNLHPKVSGEESEAPYTHQTGLYPRTAVALTEGNHFLMVVCDGRYATGYGGTGMSAYWLTEFLVQHFNPQYAINLDGGGSSTMCVRNSAFASDNFVVNYPCDNRGSSSKIHDHDGQRSRDSWIVIVDAQ